MSTQLRQALQILRDKSANDAEMGAAFEKLVKVFLEHDATQTQEYDKVWLYRDWAKERPNYSPSDIGIDLVAQLRNGSGFCAVQCKFYDSENPISKKDLDSFISASSTNDFTRLLLVDTSTLDLGKNAQNVFDNLNKEYIRIPLAELELSRIDWLTWVREDRVRLASKKVLREDQSEALKAVKDGLSKADRGKLIMACGTGKTFTSLRIAEDIAGKGKLVLYMVPSLALMSQTVREWKNDATDDFTAFSACSDVKVGKRDSKDDQIVVGIHDLAFPATTDPAKLADQIKNAPAEKMTVVFSTYHSIDVISQAQFSHGLKAFDLIVCDEAHRTTGATLVGDDESTFVRIHKNENVKGAKRLYMTATPRIFGEKARSRAEDEDIELASMDDKNIYGEVLLHRGFGWAVENNLLSDYKVVVLAVDEGRVADFLSKQAKHSLELKLDDATKMIGCYKALAKVGFKDKEQEGENHKPMRRALAFCQNIALSKMFEAEFAKVVTEYTASETTTEDEKESLVVEIQHVDGTFNAEQRSDRLNWIADDTAENVCRVLTNARCLSEGVDVPTLDAIMFLHPRKSQIDVVQSVGRVMRKAEGKSLGYVILPITVAPGVSPEKALNDNEKYKVVWQILNALRAHDERLDSTINRIGLGEDVSERLEIVGVGASEELEATTAVVEDIKTKNKKEKDGGEGEEDVIEDPREPLNEKGEQLAFVMSDLSQAIKAKIVDKCGTRDYWENWAKDIAKIAQTHITRINAIVLNEGTPERKAFNAFVEEIRDDLNPEITETEAVEMLAQHLITKPVFDTLFQGNQFTSENPVSKAMEIVLDQLHHHKLEKESETLQRFYDSVRRRARDITTSTGRQKLVLELYERFFRTAFPTLTQKLGIVYTPVEIVDFIIHSVNDVLKDEYGKTLGSKNVHILDPFTGTGTFITRLMQSGAIKPDELPHKYRYELHANEIVLLAYYIAAINIEAVYQDIARENGYQPFDGIVLTDTFQLYEQDRDMVANLLPDNSRRRTAQRERKITVIFGNPPYSAGQKSANDVAGNIIYPNLDQRIRSTYVADTKVTNKKSIYDSYIRAFRWASDRIGDEGVIGFVSGSGWVDKSFTDGMRKHLHEEFNRIYVLNLRGDIRKNILSKGLAGEGENVFGQGSMTGIAITILVKTKSKDGKKIYYRDIGNSIKRDAKLSMLRQYKSVKGVEAEGDWSMITPDGNHDWINQGESALKKYMLLGVKRDASAPALFGTYSSGIKTQRDTWCYNMSKHALCQNIEASIQFFNAHMKEYQARKNGGWKGRVEEFIDRSQKHFSWCQQTIKNFERGRQLSFDANSVTLSLYRPFTRMWVYRNKFMNWSDYLQAKSFPSRQSANRLIAVTGVGSRAGFSCLMVENLPDIQTMDNGQCFPLKLYEKPESGEGLFANQVGSEDYVMKSGISDEGVAQFQKAYPKAKITKEDLFYYIYGLLHSSEYRARFQNNLSKELPRIPAVKRYEDFKAFVDAGRTLGDLHVNYEKVEPYPVTIKEGDLRLTSIADPKSFFRVESMKFGGKRPNLDKTTVIYNPQISMTNIPLEAYDYVVNGKPALEWVMDRQCVSKDKASGVVNDANDYANETMNNSAYPLELFQRVITVSLKTMEIVQNLPKLDIDVGKTD